MAKLTFNYIFLCLLVFFSIFFSSVNSQDDACIDETPCLCKLSDNRYINISGVVGENTYLNTSSGNVTFYFSPCQDVQFPAPPDVGNITIINNCKEPSSLCVYNESDHTFTDLGKAQDHTFTVGLPKEIIYSKGPGAKVLLGCTLDDLTALVSISTTSNYVLDLVSHDNCVKHGHAGLSIGSKLLIMFTVVVGIYFIGGALVLHFLRGAQGKEMIPNVEFWSSLPGLVKDGFVFLLNGCHPIPVSNAEAYDRI